MEIREYPTQDFHALNRASINDELFDLIMWALIRKTVAHVELDVLPRDADTRYQLRLRLKRTDGSSSGELVLDTVPENQMDPEAKRTLRFYATKPDEYAFSARLKDAYISVESEQIAWAEIVQDEHTKRWGNKLLSLWHSGDFSLTLSRAPYSTLLPAPLPNTSSPVNARIVEGDSFLTLEAHHKPTAPNEGTRRIVWQIIRELSEFIVIRYESLTPSHPNGPLATTHAWRIIKDTVVNLHKKHRALSPLAIDELLGFFPIGPDWQPVVSALGLPPLCDEGHWSVTGYVRNLEALVTLLPQPVEEREAYDPNVLSPKRVLVCPQHRGVLRYEGDEHGGANMHLSVYQNDERFERAVLRGSRVVDSGFPPKTEVQ
jgi:hypothetical protein